MNHSISIKRNPRTVVHAGPILLDETDGVDSLERYLARPSERELFLVHNGRPLLRQVAHDAGVSDIKVDPVQSAPEAEKAADMAVAIGARDLEFMIDRPALKNVTGQYIRQFTLHEAESYACDPTLRQEIRRKIWAGCDALRRGLERVRIGNPRSLARGRATEILPDTPFALGAELSKPPESPNTDDEDPAPTPDPERQPLKMPGSDDGKKPLRARLSRAPSRVKALRYSPQTGCEIGPPSPYPFPDAPFFSRLPMDRRNRARTRRAVA